MKLAFLIFAVIIKVEAINKVPSIVEGEAIDIKKVPFQVSLEKYFKFKCGGSLISNYHVVTAAHCIHHIKVRNRVTENELRVRVGTSKAGVGGVIILVRLVVITSKYNSSNLSYDIGIVMLKSPAEITESVKPIALDPNWAKIGDPCFVSGYGGQQGTTQLHPADTLKMAKLEVYPNAECINKFGVPTLTDKVCAGSRKGRDGVCFGDSGGPLTINGKLAGVVSGGKGCGQLGPGEYTSIRYFYDWINKCVTETSKGANSC